MSSTVDRIRDLIQARGGSQRDFAAAIGLDPTKLSKSLSGVRRFSSLDLARIAEYAGVSVDWLLAGTDSPLALAARSAGGGAATAIGRARELSQVRSDLTLVGFPQRRREMDAPRSGGTWAEQGERAAAWARARVADSAPSTGHDDLTDLPGVIERTFGVDVAVSDLGTDFDGLAVSSNEMSLILVARSVLPSRQRFTLAHELGHLVAGDHQELHVDEDVYDPALRRDPSEARANAFAAAFLMPEGVLRGATPSDGLTEESFATLSCRLGVSPSALAFRLARLRLIDSGTQDRFRRLSAEAAARGAGRGQELAAAVSASNSDRLPGPLVRDAWAAYESGATTLWAYARVIGADAEDLRNALAGDGPAIERGETLEP